MALTRRLLRELGLEEDAAQRVIQAHAETMEGLRAERDAALAAAREASQAEGEREELRAAAERYRQESEQIRQEFDLYRRSAERQQTLRREAALTDALRRAGANEQALTLLAKAIPHDAVEWDGDALRDEAAALRDVQAAYAGLFAVRETLGTGRCTPPLTEEMISREDVRRMTPEEINRNWTQVRTALTAGGPA